MLACTMNLPGCRQQSTAVEDGHRTRVDSLRQKQNLRPSLSVCPHAGTVIICLLNKHEETWAVSDPKAGLDTFLWFRIGSLPSVERSRRSSRKARNVTRVILFISERPTALP